VPAAREALGLVHYRKGEWAKALSEFRTARRLSGSSHLLPYMVDAERGLGRPERALDLAASPEAANLGQDERIELAIVVSGIRRDLGQYEAAAVGLQLPQLKVGSRQPWAARLFYAYAEALLAKGDEDGAMTWFGHAADADVDGATDADERLSELNGLVLTDVLDDDEN
jgi:tetratricopeptide (TPR) repeat protein